MRRFLRTTCLFSTLLALALVLPVAETAAVPASDADTHSLSPLPLSKSARKWVDSALGGLSLEKKAAQLVMVRANGLYQNPASESYRKWIPR